jgi:hypothetical protein
VAIGASYPSRLRLSLDSGAERDRKDAYRACAARLRPCIMNIGICKVILLRTGNNARQAEDQRLAGPAGKQYHLTEAG